MAVSNISEVQPLVIPKEQPNFVVTPEIENIVKRSLTYLEAGFPVHFSGPAGTGKTSIAMYVAAQLEKPAILIHGDEGLSTSALVGGELGYRRKMTVDNFIQSVLKTEEKFSVEWVDARLTVACKYGYTLIYDEFTRSLPQSNNVLLSILEEGILDLPATRAAEDYLGVHPDFHAIFTSNPAEYAGVYKAQDALRDRMITIKLSHYDRDTEIAITCAKAGIVKSEAERIVDMVRSLREAITDGNTPTIRACIMIGKVSKLSGAKASANDEVFVNTCTDILDSEMSPRGNASSKELRGAILDSIKKFF